MPVIRNGTGDEIEVGLIKNTEILHTMIDHSKDQSGHNVSVEFSNREWAVLYLAYPKMMDRRICELFFFDLLKILRKIHGLDYPGFHWEMLPNRKGFRTFDYQAIS